MNTLERTIRPSFLKMLESSPLKGGNTEVYNKALERAKTTDLKGLMTMAPLLGATNCKRFRTAVDAVLVFRANKSIRAETKPLFPLVEEEIPFTFG